MSQNVQKSKGRLPVFGFCVVQLLLSACGARQQDTVHESNTNWLDACDSNAECGSALACVCGVCTKNCSQDDCPAALECMAAGQCAGEAPAACQAPCERDADCARLDAAATCAQGVCQAPRGGLDEGLVNSPPDAETSCRVAYVEYPVGGVIENTCGRTCTCQANGEPQCSSTGEDIFCPSPVRACSDMFPDWTPGASPPSDAIQLGSATLDGDTLAIDYSHSSGCERHDYALCYELAGESYPVRANLHVIHDAHGEACEAATLGTMVFDLGPLADAYQATYAVSGDIVQTPFGVYSFGTPSCAARQLGGELETQRALAAADRSCESVSDCHAFFAVTRCSSMCSEFLSQTGIAELEAAYAAIDDNICGAFEEDGCTRDVPPCEGGFAPRCEAGQCVSVPATAANCPSELPPDEQTAAQLAQRLQDNAADCAAVGVPSEPNIVSRAAAICIARRSGLEEGLAAWDVALQCYNAEHPLAWVVQNLTRDEERLQAGRVLLIDAQSGEVIRDDLAWQSMP